MGIKAHFLKDKNGNKFYPYAHANATFDSNGVKVEARLNSLDNNKVDKQDGKTLSSNDYTDDEKNKLASIQSGAEQNIQSNWNESNETSDAYIKNKPTKLPANGGDSDTVNGHTVDSDVPVNAKFTDTVYIHPDSTITPGTYKSVTVDSKGHVTSGTNPTTLSDYGITDAASSSDLEAETTRAEKKENDITSLLNAEINRATAKENEITNNLSVLETNLGDLKKEEVDNKIESEVAIDFSQADTPQFQQTIDNVFDEVNELKGDLDNIKDNETNNYVFQFEQGTLDHLTGGKADSDIRIRTVDYINYSKLNQSEKIYLANGYKLWVRAYVNGNYVCGLIQQNNSFDISALKDREIYNNDSDWSACQDYISNKTLDIKFVIGKNDDSVISPSVENSAYTKEFKINTLEIAAKSLNKEVENLKNNVLIYIEFEQGKLDMNTGEEVDSDTIIRAKERIYYKRFNVKSDIPVGLELIPRIYDSVTGDYLCGGKSITSEFNPEKLVTSEMYESDVWRINENILSSGRFDVRFIVLKTSGGNIFPYESPTIEVEKNDFFAVGDGVSDDTFEIQRYVARNKNICIPFGYYKLTDTITIKTTKSRFFDGSNSVFTITDDKEAFNIVGNCDSLAFPNSIKGKNVAENGGFQFKNVHITSTSDDLGTGVGIEYTFGIKITKCYIHNIKIGISFKNWNRNMIVADNFIFACNDYCLYFPPTANFHQCNIVDNVISYATSVIYYNDCEEIANHQIVGNDLEIGPYPTDGTTSEVIVIKSDNGKSGILCEFEISGNTIQGHNHSDRIIEIEGGNNRYIQNVSISGNHISNTTAYAVTLKKVRSVSCVGNTYKECPQYAFLLDGDIKYVSMVGETGFDMGGLIRALSTSILESVKTVACCFNNNRITVETSNGSITDLG